MVKKLGVHVWHEQRTYLLRRRDVRNKLAHLCLWRNYPSSPCPADKERAAQEGQSSYAHAQHLADPPTSRNSGRIGRADITPT